MTNNSDKKLENFPAKPLLDSLPEAQEPSLIAYAPSSKAQVKLSREQELKAEEHFRQANLLRMRSELKQSLAELVKAIEIDPCNASMTAMRGELLARLGRLEEAITEYEKAKSLARTPQEISAIEAKIVALIAGRKDLKAAFSEEASLIKARDKNWGVIALASFLLPGLGQILIGQTAKGAVFLALSIVSYLVMFWPVISRQAPTTSALAISGEFAFALAILVIAVADIIVESKKGR